MLVSTVWVSGSSSVLLLRSVLMLRYGGPLVGELLILSVRRLVLVLLVHAILNLWSLLLVLWLHSPVACCSHYSLQTCLHGILTIPCYIIVLITKMDCFTKLWQLLPWTGTWHGPYPLIHSNHLLTLSWVNTESRFHICCRSQATFLVLPI